ncbi:MAG TPA: GIY-YIG nuclease family protein [bacterium]|nr:GIY-YIG nuclease family protein [bacterium]
MHLYVYIIRNKFNPEQTYVGATRNLKKRILGHNEGKFPHTAKYRPWKIETAGCLRR